MVRRVVGMGGFPDFYEPAPGNGLRPGCAHICAHLYELVVGEVSVRILQMKPKNLVLDSFTQETKKLKACPAGNVMRVKKAIYTGHKESRCEP